LGLREVTNPSPEKKRKTLYIVLRANYWSNKTMYGSGGPESTTHDGIQFLRQSLRTDHFYDEKNYEVTLPELSWYNAAKERITIPRIKLNVQDLLRGDEIMRFKRRSTRKLFEKTALRSNFCFYSSREVCTLESPNIIGMGGPISERGGLAPICVLNHRSSKKLWQLIICTPDCPEVRPIISEGLCGQILGYRYIFQPYIEEQGLD
jgi:hypothetical protein